MRVLGGRRLKLSNTCPARMPVTPGGVVELSAAAVARSAPGCAPVPDPDGVVDLVDEPPNSRCFSELQPTIPRHKAVNATQATTRTAGPSLLEHHGECIWVPVPHRRGVDRSPARQAAARAKRESQAPIAVSRPPRESEGTCSATGFFPPIRC